MSNDVEILRQMLNGQSDSAVNKYGYNNDVDAQEDIWSVGGLYPFATFKTVQTLEIVSTSIEDATGGTGAIQVTISGLDANNNEQDETVTMTGTTAVILTNTYNAVNRAFIVDGQTGSTGSNVGIINIRVSVGGTVVSQIPATRGQTQQAIYRVPNTSKYLRVTDINSYTDAAVGKSASMQIISVGTDCQTVRVRNSGTINENQAWIRSYRVGGIKVKSGEWVAIRALSVVQANTIISGEFDGVLE